jgi:hypothetical protein
MDSTISKLMKAYEKMSRRELIQGMALLTASAAAVEAQEIAPIVPLHEKPPIRMSQIFTHGF